ncbi:Granulocyte-macrophage colony-stimulating factor, partial [Dissostichus eleginoides]
LWTSRQPDQRLPESSDVLHSLVDQSVDHPFSRKGYEHFYDGEKNTGYLSWRLRIMSRKNRATRSQQAVPATVPQAQGPNRPRSAPTVPHQLDGDACREALSFLVHSPDEASVFEKMRITLQHHQDLVRDPQQTADVFKTFPRFLDIKGLLTQDFLLLFGTETACKMFEKWDTAFKIKIIKEAKHLTQSTELCRLLNAAETLEENDDTRWDSDMASLLLLLYLLPPTAGRKRTTISPSDAVDKMVHFHKSCCSIDEHLGEERVNNPTSTLGAFDKLFKSHYVFNLSYEESLVQLYTFVQTTVYNIDINTTDESPRIRELRAKLLN